MTAPIKAPTQAPTQATDLAAATAKVAHGGVQHGDNDPEATARLRYWIEGIDAAEPRVAETDRARAMCAAWRDHETARTPVAQPGREVDNEGIERLHAMRAGGPRGGLG